MSRLLIVILLVLLAALLYHCLVMRPPQIEADVLACVEDRMAGEFDNVEVTIDGRDVRLVGSVGNEASKDRAANLANQDCGARVVVNDLEVRAIAAVPAAPYRTRLCIDANGIRVDGTVPDAEAERRYLEIASARLGDVAVETDFTVRSDAPRGYNRLMQTAVAELAQMDEGCIEFVDGQVRVTGEVRSADVRDRLVADFDRAAGDDFSLSYELTVPRLSEAALACQNALNALLAPGELVLFDFDSAELHTEGRALLDEAEDLWETCPDISLIVAGHTDSVGEAEYNRALSERRARAVAEYLIEQGFDPDRLTPIGYGEAQPIATNETEEGRALNRRMEFRVRETSQ